MSGSGAAKVAPGDDLPAVLLLGDPRLRRVARRVDPSADPALDREIGLLHGVLARFRSRHGFGRAVSAPQIGIEKRIVALDLGEGPFTMLNPRITWASSERFTLWDDCMSFPDLLVRIERHASVSVSWLAPGGEAREWERVERARSELVQHEIDHLDGILAVDRALDRDALRLRAEHERLSASPD